MLGENIKTLRKQKGFSQETLAQQLNVVRQTVSKWEKGYSVPDAEMLNTLSELFEVPVSTLLGGTIPEAEKQNDSRIDEIANQLAILNEQLANKTARRRKVIKRILLCFLIVIILFVLLIVINIATRHSYGDLSTTEIACAIDGETYLYEFSYDDNFIIHESGGSAWLYDHCLLDKYDNVNVAIAQIEDYITDHGGTYKITELDE